MIGPTSNEISERLDIPAGHVHRSVLLDRGWSGELITRSLTPVKVVVPERLQNQNLSNKAYPLEEVEAAEQALPEVRQRLEQLARARAKAHGTIARDCRHEHDAANTHSRKLLVDSGWLVAQVDRLLGTEPDWREEVDVVAEYDGRVVARTGWCRDRAARAEKEDQALRRRLKKLVKQVDGGGSKEAHRAAVTSSSALASPELTAVVVPDVQAGARRSWRKLVKGVIPGKEGAFALDGVFLDPGLACMIEPGAVIVTCDVMAEDRVVTVLKVSATGAEVIKDWTLKSALGQRVVTWVERRLALPAAIALRKLEPSPNRWPGWCHRCRQEVAAGEGLLLAGGGRRLAGGGRRRLVMHAAGKCPPPPPRPPQPNEYPSWCESCRRAVEPGTGWVSAAETATAFGTFTRWVVKHRTEADCLRAVDYFVNRAGDWCAECSGWIHSGHGRWSQGAVRHIEGDRACRAPEIGLWRVTSKRGLAVGQSRRMLLTPKTGQRPVPDGAPGRHAVDEATVSVVVTVVDVRSSLGGSVALVRAATWEEAGPVLADEAEAAAHTQPIESRFRAPWSGVRRDGTDPWLAEITGFDVGYGLAREFLAPAKDYMNASNSLLSGVQHQWVLHPNRVYEASAPRGRYREDRYFVRVTSEGDVEEITREQVDAWLLYGGVSLLEEQAGTALGPEGSGSESGSGAVGG